MFSFFGQKNSSDPSCLFQSDIHVIACVVQQDNSTPPESLVGVSIPRVLSILLWGAVFFTVFVYRRVVSCGSSTE